MKYIIFNGKNIVIINKLITDILSEHYSQEIIKNLWREQGYFEFLDKGDLFYICLNLFIFNHYTIPLLNVLLFYFDCTRYDST